MNRYNFKERIFSLALDAVLEQGGDGGATVVCREYKKIAREFFDWYVKNRNIYFKIKDNSEGKYPSISIGEDQEWITFVPKLYDGINYEFDDIIIQLGEFITLED
jgi:hypothetical protein